MRTGSITIIMASIVISSQLGCVHAPHHDTMAPQLTSLFPQTKRKGGGTTGKDRHEYRDKPSKSRSARMQVPKKKIPPSSPASPVSNREALDAAIPEHPLPGVVTTPLQQQKLPTSGAAASLDRCLIIGNVIQAPGGNVIPAPMSSNTCGDGHKLDYCVEEKKLAEARANDFYDMPGEQRNERLQLVITSYENALKFCEGRPDFEEAIKSHLRDFRRLMKLSLTNPEEFKNEVALRAFMRGTSSNGIAMSPSAPGFQ